MIDRAIAFRHRLKPTHRVFLSTVGAYAVAATSAAASAMSFAAAGLMEKGAALVWTTLLGFFVYFFAALWTFTEQKAWRLWVVFSTVTTISVLVVWRLGGDPTFGFGGG